MLEKLPKMQAPTTFDKEIANVEEFKTTTVGDVCSMTAIFLNLIIRVRANRPVCPR